MKLDLDFKKLLIALENIGLSFVSDHLQNTDLAVNVAWWGFSAGAGLDIT